MSLDRATVDRTAAAHVRELMRAGHVSPERKRQIRIQHEQAAAKAARKSAKR